MLETVFWGVHSPGLISEFSADFHGDEWTRGAARGGRVSAERRGSYFRLRAHRLATPSPVCLSSFRIL